MNRFFAEKVCDGHTIGTEEHILILVGKYLSHLLLCRVLRSMQEKNGILVSTYS